MRILKIIFKSLLYLTIIGVIALLVSREVFLLIGLNRVKNMLDKAREAKKSARYTSYCNANYRIQLRFVSANELVLEVDCYTRDKNPLVIRTEELPSLVTHQKGQSGLIWGGQQNAINLHCLNRTGSVQIKTGYTEVSLKPAEVKMGSGPLTECRSFGFECCDSKYQQGDGQQIFETKDCPENCFYTCKDRPLVLGFTSQPRYDPMDRTVQISSGRQVEFNYVVSPDQRDNFESLYQEELAGVEKWLYHFSTLFNPELKEEVGVNVVLDFGDGSRETFTDFKGGADHRYQCSQDRCEYTAKLFVTNHKGIESYQGIHSRVNVVVD